MDKQGACLADTVQIIYDVLRNWRLSTMAQEDEPSEGYPLMDAVSTPDTTIETGEAELGEIAYAIAGRLAHSAPTGDSYTKELEDEARAAFEADCIYHEHAVNFGRSTQESPRGFKTEILNWLAVARAIRDLRNRPTPTGEMGEYDRGKPRVD